MRKTWHHGISIAAAIVLCLCTPAPAAESTCERAQEDMCPSSISEIIRQKHISDGSYLTLEDGYIPAIGDVAFYDIDKDGVADAHGMICAMSDGAQVCSIAFDTLCPTRMGREQFPDCKMGYGVGGGQEWQFCLPVAPDFIFI